MLDYKSYFKGKKVTLVGLGLLGRGLGDAIFLAECGAKLTITDLKNEEQLKESLKKLKKFKDIKYVLGKHQMEDFLNADIIVKAAGVPLDSPFILEAKKKKIPIEMDESLFTKFAEGVKIVGVTGTRGKSTTTVLIYEILKAAKMKVHLGGNIRGMATLPLIKKVKKGDVVVMELSSWQLQGFGEAKISPDISVFTNFMPDHMNYYNNDLDKYFQDKAYIYRNQKKGDVLVLGPSMKDIRDAKGTVVVVNHRNVPKSWKPKLQGTHNLENIACAIEVARSLEIPENVIQKAVENFKPVEGRLEPVRNIRGVQIYNDTNSCTPEATIAALKTVGSNKKNVILIVGGSDKNLNLKNLVKEMKKYCKAIVLIPGNGTERLGEYRSSLKTLPMFREASLELVVKKAQALAKRNDVVLFSPGFTSFGMFENEYDRGDQFMKIVKKLK